MPSEFVSSTLKFCKRYLVISGFFAVIVSLTVLIGWTFNFIPLKSVLSYCCSLQVEAAICFLFLGASIILKVFRSLLNRKINHLVSNVLAGTVLLWGTCLLLEYSFGWNFKIYELIFVGPKNALAHNTDRMAFVTALNFVIMAAALLMLKVKYKTVLVTRVLAGIAWFIALIPMLGYLVGMTALTEVGISNKVNMAVHTSLVFLILSQAIFLFYPRYGIVKVIISDTAGGILARRLLPAILFVVPLVRWLIKQGEDARIYDRFFAVALFVTLIILIFGTFVLQIAKRLYKTDREYKLIQKRITEAKEEALSASRMKSEFLANISHEIRTPLNAILGLTEITLEGELNDVQRRNLEIVQSSGTSLMKIIDDILDFSLIEAGKIDLHSSQFELKQLLASVLLEFAEQANAKNLELSYSLDSWLPNCLKGDSAQLKQILINLVGNAIKFTEQGRVQIKAQVHSRTQDQITVHFQVSDTGIGLTKEKQNLVLEPFVQADGSASRKYGGTGIGLSITVQLVELLKGKLWIDSTEGQGSTFHFTAKLQNLPESVLWNFKEKLSGHILLVDNNRLSRQIVKEQLEDLGLQVVVAANVQQALEILKGMLAGRYTLSLVILDIDLPDMSGFKVAEMIKSDAQLANLKIIMLHSLGHPNVASRVKELKLEASIAKPIELQKLTKTVRQVLGKPSITETLSAAQDTGCSKMKILLAEDSIVNQIMASQILRKAGHEVVIANNGLEAVVQSQKQDFDLIFMDIHMPDVDGFEATSLIRQTEAGRGRRVPIIAVTANVIKGIQESCLEAGMDDYISKPFSKKELLESATNVFSGVSKLAKELLNETVIETKPTSQAYRGENIVDWNFLMSQVDDNLEVIQDLIDSFELDSKARLEKINEAISSKDAALLGQAAHSLKGSISNFSKNIAFEHALQLEIMGRHEKLDDAKEVFDLLREDVTQLLNELKRLLARNNLKQTSLA
jgi:two-component system, sensor histidine kinase and response regulator